MNTEQAKARGYAVIAASNFEVGLIKDGLGIKTWWCQDFDRKLPDLDHPLIKEAIEINEKSTQWPGRENGRLRWKRQEGAVLAELRVPGEKMAATLLFV